MAAVKGTLSDSAAVVGKVAPAGLPGVGARLHVLLAVLVALGGSAAAGGEIVAYGAKVAFRQDQAIPFEDFQLTFVGQHRETPSVYPRGFLYFDFQVAAGRQRLKVSWTAGTGLIAPAQFEVSGRRYLLELKWSHPVGRLKEDELVVRRAESTP